MAITKMPIGKFVDELEAALKRKDGYIMGSKGQKAKDLSDWYYNQYKDRDNYTEKQEEKALYWRDNAEQVWDCNGLAEGIYEKWSGVNINTRARYNYSGWCTTKGTGMIPVKYRVPGAAVFWGNKAATITHVAYLYKPVTEGKPEEDWYIIEARGVMYGVVKTTLSSRKPNFWGLMEKYFDYSNASVDNAENNTTIDDAVTVTGNSVNIRKGPSTSCGILKVAHEGDQFERVNPSGWVCIEYNNAIRWVSAKYVEDGMCIASSLNVRTGPGTNYASVGTVHKGYKFIMVDVDGWVPILIGGTIYWVSAKYAE